MQTITQQNSNKKLHTNGVCLLCGAQMSVFFQVDRACVFSNVLNDTYQEAVSAPQALIHLAHCRRCDLIYNIAFDPKLMRYSPHYENSLHYSPRFQSYARELAGQLIERYGLYEKHIVEIGCGQGNFLALLQQLGNNYARGFDPSYSFNKDSVAHENPRLTILPEPYGHVHANPPADFFCCRHVLEHIAEPLEFLRNIRNTIGKDSNTVVYFEVPNALYILRDLGIWDVIYEHCSYFTAKSLSRLFMRAGFAPVRIAHVYGDQFLTIEAKVAQPDGQTNGKIQIPKTHTHDFIEKFCDAYQEKVRFWEKKLAHYEKNDEIIVLWGAGSKGITFLNTLNISNERIGHIVDLNPRKQGKYVTGTGQHIVAPVVLKDIRPQTIIIMNPIYRQEIEIVLQDLHISSDILVA